jgi:MFS family permease
MAGSSVITFYSNIVLEHTLGYTALNARIISNCLQTWHFLWAFVGMALIDRVGRRPLLIGCAGLMAVSLAGLAGLSSIDGNKAAAGCTLLFYFIALAVYPVGLFLVPFMYASEIAPPGVRSRITAIASCMTWLTDFWIAETSPTAFAEIGWKYYLVFVGTNILSVVVFYFFVPETKGKSLEDIDAIFVMTDSSWRAVRVARDLGPIIDEESNLAEKSAPTVEHKDYIEC